MSEGDNQPVALVTSGTSGLGAKIVRRLHDGGIRVAAGETPGTSNGEPFKTAASVHRGLLSSPADCERVVKEVLEQHGRLDILVCTALRRGLSTECLLERCDASEWDGYLASYLSGPFYVIRAALGPMLEQRYGRIVAVLPIDGQRGSVGQAVAGVASAGLATLTRRLAREVGGRGVTVNAVVAGLIEIGWSMDELPGDAAAQIRASIPVGRPCEKAEVADMVAHLCAPEAGYITGQVVAVDGGFGA